MRRRAQQAQARAGAGPAVRQAPRAGQQKSVRKMREETKVYIGPFDTTLFVFSGEKTNYIQNVKIKVPTGTIKDKNDLAKLLEKAKNVAKKIDKLIEETVKDIRETFNCEKIDEIVIEPEYFTRIIAIRLNAVKFYDARIEYAEAKPYIVITKENYNEEIIVTTKLFTSITIEGDENELLGEK